MIDWCWAAAVKIVADTMLWVSYCSGKTTYRHRLIEKACRQRVRFFVSEFILQELSETLIEGFDQPRRFASLAQKAVLRIAKKVELRLPSRPIVTGDPNDDPIVQTALLANVDYLVTADKEILKLGKFRNIEILTPEEFEKRLRPEV